MTRYDDADQSPAQRRVLVIVPAHNEAKNIPAVTEDLRRYLPSADIVVIDDASTDSTVEVVRKCGLAVLRLPCNLGVGGAMQLGYIYAHRGGYDAAVQFDGDGQHRANQIPSLLEGVLAGRADLVIGSRVLEGVRFRFHPLRFIGSRILASLVSAIVGCKITDPTSGFRAASKRAIAFFAAQYPQTYLGDTAQALVWAGRNKMHLAEVPTRMRQRRAGQSAANNLTGLWHVLRITLALLVDCLKPRFKKPL
ncbi:MAG: glycosyltransferase family 2 protein [Phycisphaerae bacterium]|nr:glycosyltransferase family 2 protein [Phycisphaerae bacterium]